MEVVLVAHTRAREVRHALPHLTAALTERGVRCTAVHAVGGERALRAAVRSATRAGAATVIVAGGDGAMTHAVDELAHEKTALGVVPLGTGNSFARSLDVPLGDLGAAVDTIVGGRIVNVDLGTANDVYFANFATVGLSSAIAASTGGPLKGALGRFAYGIAALRPLLAQRAFRARLRHDAGKLEVRTLDLVIANGRYFGSTAVSSDASLTDGRLTVFVTGERNAIEALRTYVAFGFGRGTSVPDAHVLTTRELRVRTKPRQPVAIDGSLLTRTPVTFGVAPRALRVHVGAAFDGAR